MANKRFDLPLRYDTPDDWAAQVLSRPLELLNDHAHLEKKAATNALELLNRWPEPNPPENWVTAMTASAATTSADTMT
jgi:tRNA-(ms[2]io[6]A)-hydroxylase